MTGMAGPGGAGDRAALAEHISALAVEAAAEILDVAARDIAVSSKSDETPVTEADRRAEEVILAGLGAHYPDIPVVAEEAVSAGHCCDISQGTFFLVDPLDGTKEFINRRTDYTVNIALIEQGRPVAGVVCAPARRAIWRGSGGETGAIAEKASLDEALELGAWQSITCRPPAKPPVIVATRSHMTPETASFLGRFPESACVSVGSSLKFCLLAEGSADIYPRFGPTMEWDTAAGDAVLRAAGGTTRTLDGAPLRYGGQNVGKPFLNPYFIATSHEQFVIA